LALISEFLSAILWQAANPEDQSWLWNVST